MSFLTSLGSGFLGKAIDFGFDQLSGSSNSKRSWKYTSKEMDKQYALNEKAAENSFQRSIKAWNMENEYNSPSAYMQRLKDAGLNPWSAAGASFHNASLSSPDQAGVSAPSVNTRPSTFQSFASVLDTFQTIKERNARIDLLKQESLLKKSQIGEISQRIAESIARTGGINTRTALSEFQLGLARELRDNTIQTAINRKDLLGEQVGLAKIKRLLSQQDWDSFSKRGIRSSDSIWLRLLDRFLDHAGIGMGSFFQ